MCCLFFLFFGFVVAYPGDNSLNILTTIALGEETNPYKMTVKSPTVLGDAEERKNVKIADAVQGRAFFVSGVEIPQLKEKNISFALPTAHASVILDVDSGTILHYEEGRERRPIASLTKIMTALIVMEELKLNDIVTITQEMRSVEGTVVGCPRSGYCIDTRLQIGEQITVRELMKAMLMNSANDSATALAIHIDGSVEKFSVRMNQKAKDLGLVDSKFCTPSGLEIEGKECYSSAYDIARIAVEALKYDEIWRIMNLPSGTTITSIEGKYTHNILNTNALLGEDPSLVGTKTGFTPKAGYCLLAVSESPNRKHRIVSVVLDDPYRWGSIKDMANWVFSSYEWR
jgi:D-alanyl-D-alanine carboxypeptidase (penicillin-binding protein 5/6)